MVDVSGLGYNFFRSRLKGGPMLVNPTWDDLLDNFRVPLGPVPPVLVNHMTVLR